jgi:phosphoribosylanthranilate isomerase
MRKIPVFTTKVAVTSTEETRTILAICSMLRPDAIQIHKHKPNLLESLRSQYPETQIILATALHDRSSIKNAIETSAYSDALLADSPGRNGIGGTGRVHDWAITASVRDQIYPHPLILAGGLTPGNVREAIRKVRPFAVDVSTGVEKKIGLKDRDKIKEFIKNAKENLS